jgi:hypothetical protein
VLLLSVHGPIAGRLRAFDRRLRERPGVVLVANGVLDRYDGELATMAWHLLIADQALRYRRSSGCAWDRSPAGC